MKEKDIVDEALKYWNANHNCAQSTASGSLDYFGFEEESKTLCKACFPYGGGVGVRTICGSLLGALAALSFLLKEKDIANEQIYEKIKTLKQEFDEKNGSMYCKELLQEYIFPDGTLDRDNPDRRKVCDNTVETAVKIVRNLVEN